MKTITELKNLEAQLEQLKAQINIQDEPTEYGWKLTPVKANIEGILNWIDKYADGSKTEHNEYAFDLLNRSISLLQIFYKNHPWRKLYDNNK